MNPKPDINKLLESSGRHDDGLTVPAGYFESFAKRIAQKTAAAPAAAEPPAPRTFWQKARPYIYMAAMFAGIWCMMKMASMMRPEGDTGISPVLAEALSDDNFISDYYLEQEYDETLLYDLYEEGYTPASFTAESNSFDNSTIRVSL